MKLAGAIDCEPTAEKGVKRVHEEVCDGNAIIDRRELSYLLDSCSFGTVNGGLGSHLSSSSASYALSSSSTLLPFIQ